MVEEELQEAEVDDAPKSKSNEFTVKGKMHFFSYPTHPLSTSLCKVIDP